MGDIAPALIDAIKDEFRNAYENSARIQQLLDAVKRGTATYKQAQQYAIDISRLIGQAYEKHVSSASLPDGKMYYNIASRLIPETLDENYRLVADYAKRVQESLNKQAGLGLKAQVAALDEDRVDGLVQLAASKEQYDEVGGQLLSKFETYSQSIVDHTIQANVDFQGRSGLRPVVYRRSNGRCCDWCRALVGKYEYPVEREVYQRHENCRCTVLYDPGDGRTQNVHTKRWTDSVGDGILEARKNYGVLSGDNRRYLPDIQIGKSVGAKSQNYDILDPSSGEYFRFAEGSRIRNVEVFAGFGSKRPLRREVAEGLQEQIGGSAEKWQHCKGYGVIDCLDEDRPAEVHWFQEETIGKVKFKVKRWLDES